MPSNPSHLGPVLFARRLVNLLETKIAKIACHAARPLSTATHLAPLRRLFYVLETKVARLPGNLGRNLGPKGKHSR